MIKNYQQLRNRRKFVKNCVNNPKVLSRRLKMVAKRIDSGKTIIVKELAGLLYLDERTIYRDLQK